MSRRDWPGNIREIENCIERAVVMCSPDVDVLDGHHFFLENRFSEEERFHAPSSNMTLQEVEKSLILRMLKEQNNNRTKTAELLGISVRTLRNKLNEYRKEGVVV